MRVFRGIKPDAEFEHKCTAKPVDTKQCKYCKFKDDCIYYTVPDKDIAETTDGD